MILKPSVVYYVVIWGALAVTALYAAPTPTEDSLETQLEALSVPANTVPPSADAEKLYSVQTRYVALRHRHEVTVTGARNFTSDSFLSSQQVELGYRFYFSDRFYTGLSGSYVFNSFTDAGNRLMEKEKLVPDVSVPKYRADLLAGYNLFYGKFRLTMDQVFYFDQYVALGPGLVSSDLSTQFAAVGDIGFVFWFGKDFSARVGLKDYFFKEKRQRSEGMVHSLLGHFDFGWVFG